MSARPLRRPLHRVHAARSSYRAVLASLVGLAVFVSASTRAEAQLEPVAITLHGIFGDQAFLSDGYGTLVLEIENRTRRTLSGKGVVIVGQPYGGVARRRHEVRVDLPPRARRRVLFTVFAGANGTSVSGFFEIDGSRVAEQSLSTNYSAGSRSVVLLTDPPRLRGGLLDLEIDLVDRRGGSGTRTARVPLGLATPDPRTGDPLLPEDAVGYATVSTMVASAPLLARASAPQRSALEDWLRAGGRLLVLPRGDGDLNDAQIRGLIGEVSRAAASVSDVYSPLVPLAASRSMLSCGEGLRVEQFGCSRGFGFGRVFVASFDANTQSNAIAPETRELVRAVLAGNVEPGVSEPLLRFGAQEEQQNESSYYGAYNNGISFGLMRAALDPNESYKPGLAIAAVLLLLYVVLVGPVNFRIVGKRGKPTLALLSTPLIATCGLVLMLGVGFLGKGVLMRYRRVEVSEAVEGERLAPSRRYTSLFLTRPVVFDLEAPTRGVISMVPGGTGDVPPTTEHPGGTTRLHDVRGRLWETLFAREDRIADLGGAITFERDGRRLAFVRNGTSQALRGAVIIDPIGTVFVVGSVPPGGRAAIPTTAHGTLSAPGAYYGGSGTVDPAITQLARDLGLVAGEDDDVMQGVVALAGGSLATPPLPTLFARVDAQRDRVGGGLFAREDDFRFLRIVPRLPGTSLGVAPPPSSPQNPVGAPPIVAPLDPDLAIDPFGVGDSTADAGVDGGAQ